MPAQHTIPGIWPSGSQYTACGRMGLSAPHVTTWRIFIKKMWFLESWKRNVAFDGVFLNNSSEYVCVMTSLARFEGLVAVIISILKDSGHFETVHFLYDSLKTTSNKLITEKRCDIPHCVCDVIRKSTNVLAPTGFSPGGWRLFFGGGGGGVGGAVGP